MLGENDYYWFHSSIDDRFWIISETVLHEKGYISNANDKKINAIYSYQTINGMHIYIIMIMLNKRGL